MFRNLRFLILGVFLAGSSFPCGVFAQMPEEYEPEGLTAEELEAWEQARAEFLRESPQTARGPGFAGEANPLERPIVLTPEEQTLMNEVGALGKTLTEQGLTPQQIDAEIENRYGDKLRELEEKHGIPPGERDDARLRELYERGRPVGGALEHRGAPELRPEHGVVYDPAIERQYRENLEKMRGEWMRDHPEYQGAGDIERHREWEKEHGKDFEGKEHGGKEIPEPKESLRESMESRESMYEPPTHERTEETRHSF